MGQRRNLEIASIQAHIGIRPVQGEAGEALNELQRSAYELVRVIELERSGIRDGDGCWSGCWPLEHLVGEIGQAFNDYKEAVRS